MKLFAIVNKKGKLIDAGWGSVAMYRTQKAALVECVLVDGESVVKVEVPDLPVKK